MNFLEQNDSLLQMQNILSLIDNAPLISANILMQPGNRGKITIWAMSVYNNLLAEK